jgi:cobalt/nickel transport system permease protein
VGLLLGWCAFPAILIALLLQGLFFQFGGITTLGVNTLIMALPAVICYYLFSPFIVNKNTSAMIAAFLCGFLCVFLSAVIMGASLVFSEENFLEISALVIVAHLPVMVIEGVITAFCIVFLKKVKPELISQTRNSVK